MALNRILKLDEILFCSETSKYCQITQKKNDNNEIGNEENTIPFHQNKSQVKSGFGFV